jgi:hypothetical protein
VSFWLRCLAPIAFVLLAGWPVPAAAQETRVIPPGQERVLAKISGRDDPEVGGCRMQSANVDKDHALLEYRCAGIDAPVKLKLVHPESTSELLGRTGRLALASAGAPAPPEPLVGALLTRMRQHDGEWTWATVVPGMRDPVAVDGVPASGWLSPPKIYVLGAIAAAGVGLAAFGIARRRRRRASE